MAAVAATSNQATWLGGDIPMLFITLTNTTTARAVGANATFTSLGLHVSPFVVQKHPRGSVVGIFRSHVEALRHMSEVAQTSPSPLFVIFEDDIVVTDQYSADVMQTIVDELVSAQTEFDMAYLGSIQWVQLLPWMPPWHRKTLHTLDHAFSTMHANVYSRRGLATVLPILETKLMEMESNPDSEPSHVDLFLEHDAATRGIQRWQVVPYMIDQDWETPSFNTDRCKAADIDCSPNEQENEQRYLREGRHIEWSKACFEVGGYPVRFYLIFIPSVMLCLFLVGYLCYRCYRTRRCCFSRCPPDPAPEMRKGGAAPSESSALLVKQ